MASSSSSAGPGSKARRRRRRPSFTRVEEEEEDIVVYDDTVTIFNPAQMEVLRAVCDTLIPSLPLPPPSALLHVAHVAACQEEVCHFFSLSAADLDGFPEQVASKMCRVVRPKDLAAVRLVLWLLSTRAGTLLLGGWPGTKSSFPFLVSFRRLPLRQREKLLYNWSVSSSGALQGLFAIFKRVIMRQFYTQVDDEGKNLGVWKALDYCGPDPRVGSVNADPCDRDLEQRVVNMKERGALAKLVELGVEVLVQGDHELCDEEEMAAPEGLRGSAGRQKKKQNNEKKKITKVKADAVIVGSGCGGAVVAAQLAAAGHRVLVLEKGDHCSRADMTLLEGSACSMYELEASLATEDGAVIIIAGSTVGGGSAVNWSASFETPPHVRREWAREVGLFGEPRYEQAMAEVRRRLGVQDGSVEEEGFSNAALRRGCEALGVHVGTVPRNAPADHFCGWCGMGCKSGRKQSANRTWLADATRAGAVVLANCEARRILLDHVAPPSTKRMRARGVTTDGHVVVEARAVVAACGALWTPPLLRRSGLRNPHIGQHLHIHPVMNAWGYFPPGRRAGAAGGELPASRSYEGGIMTAYSRHAANWDSSGYGALLMVPSLHPGAYAAFMPWRDGGSAKERMLGMSRTAHVIALTRDKGEGEVAEDGDGRLRVRYRVSEGDRGHCLEAVELALRALAAAGAEEMGTHNADGLTYKVMKGGHGHGHDDNGGHGREDDGDDHDDAFEAYLSSVRSFSIRRLNTPLASAHQMGSCRMGARPSTSAVDPSGETWEASGLFVADTSVFPGATGVNPMITVQSIALCTSQHILEFLRTTSPSTPPPSHTIVDLK